MIVVGEEEEVVVVVVVKEEQVDVVVVVVVVKEEQVDVLFKSLTQMNLQTIGIAIGVLGTTYMLLNSNKTIKNKKEENDSLQKPTTKPKKKLKTKVKDTLETNLTTLSISDIESEIDLTPDLTKKQLRTLARQKLESEQLINSIKQVTETNITLPTTFPHQESLSNSPKKVGESFIQEYSTDFPEHTSDSDGGEWQTCNILRLPKKNQVVQQVQYSPKKRTPKIEDLTKKQRENVKKREKEKVMKDLIKDTQIHRLSVIILNIFFTCLLF